MSRVFVVHRPTGKDKDSGEIIPTMDLSPAQEFGDLKFILREDRNPFKNIQGAMAETVEYLETEGFSQDDWLLLVGNPTLIAIVASAATMMVDKLRVLQWDRNGRKYRPVEITLEPFLNTPARG